MVRTIALAALGAIIGCAAAVLYIDNDRSASLNGSSLAGQVPPAQVEQDAIPVPVSFDSSRIAHEELGGVNDPAELESLIQCLAKRFLSA